MLLARDLIRRNAACYPDKTAFIAGEQTRTWAEMDARSDRWVCALAKLGVTKGDVIAILSYDPVEVMEHFFACMKGGFVRTGINWRYASREMLHLIRDSDARAIIVQAPLADQLADFWQALQAEDRQIIGFGGNHGFNLDLETLLAGADTPPELPPISADDRLALSYTTGTTGLPKGAIWHHSMLRESQTWSVLAAGLHHEDIWLTPVPLPGATAGFPTYGMVNGMTTVIQGDGLTIDGLLDVIEKHRVTVLLIIPTLLQRLLEAQKKQPRDLSSLRLLAYGSSPAMPSLIREAIAVIGCDMIQGYSTTESTTGWLTIFRQADHQRAIDGEPGLLKSCGRANIQAELSIRDPQGNPCDSGTVGELWVRAPHMINQYLNRPDENRENFVDGWYLTGDMGFIDQEGFLYLTDRKKFMIISGGYNVYPVVVEAVLAEHPAVRESSVFGVAHPDWGEAVVALVSLN
ncbi:MAG: AMP-binding protein, partial [Gammaproteobacteria bacterium]